MNRRNFLFLFGAGVAGIAIQQAIPFGRVWSFPKEIVVPEVSFEEFAFDQDFARSFKVGQTIRVRIPQRFLINAGQTRYSFRKLFPDDVTPDVIVTGLEYYSGAPPTLPPVIQLKSRRAFPDVGIPES